MLRSAFCFILFMAMFSSLNAQNQHGIGVSYRTGALLAHRVEMGHLVQRSIHSTELQYFRNLKDSSSWAKHYKWATVGLSFLYSGTGNKEILGHAYGGMLFGELGIIERKRIQFGTRTAFGLGYLTKKFDQESNMKNVAISSHFNCLVLLGVIVKYKFLKSELYWSADFTHFSNGKWSVPNLGVNNAMLNFGYRRKFATGLKRQVSRMAEPTERWKTSFILGVASESEFPTGSRRYLNAESNFLISKKLGKKVDFETGMDIIYKGALKGYAVEFSKNNIDLFQVSANVGSVFKFDRFSALISFGAYIVDVYQPAERIYQKVGVRYRFTDNLFGQLVLKSTFGRADYLLYSIGYQFKSKRK